MSLTTYSENYHLFQHRISTIFDLDSTSLYNELLVLHNSKTHEFFNIHQGFINFPSSQKIGRCGPSTLFTCTFVVHISRWLKLSDARLTISLFVVNFFTFSTSLKPLNGICPNLTGSKNSTSSAKFVFFGPIGKTRWPPSNWLAEIFSTSSLKPLNRICRNLKATRTEHPLTSLCFSG